MTTAARRIVSLELYCYCQFRSHCISRNTGTAAQWMKKVAMFSTCTVQNHELTENTNVDASGCLAWSSLLLPAFYISGRGPNVIRSGKDAYKKYRIFSFAKHYGLFIITTEQEEALFNGSNWPQEPVIYAQNNSLHTFGTQVTAFVFVFNFLWTSRWNVWAVQYYQVVEKQRLLNKPTCREQDSVTNIYQPHQINPKRQNYLWL